MPLLKSGNIVKIIGSMWLDLNLLKESVLGKGTESQWSQISQAIEYAIENNINVTIRFIK